MKFRDIFAHVLPALIVATPVVMILSRLGPIAQALQNCVFP